MRIHTDHFGEWKGIIDRYAFSFVSISTFFDSQCKRSKANCASIRFVFRRSREVPLQLLNLLKLDRTLDGQCNRLPSVRVE